MRLFNSLDVSASGLIASRVRMDVISSNLANVNTTRTENGEPYRRKQVVFEEYKPNFQQILQRQMKANNSNGVHISRIVQDPSPFKLIYDPTHPDALQEGELAGYVQMPNVDVVSEMVDMISATRAYEANVTAVNSAKSMAMKALEIGRG
ncbi:MAG: flagellar basal body rod protein FlgC [Bacillota bacterium]|nr:flagellar basal body rod protein FlgC [Bacillota bacterium]